MQKEKISIIIPIYNSERYIKRCLNSVINQTYENIEIIGVNDGSNDDSLKILEEYKELDNRIIIIDKKNEGVSSARNDGIKKSTGKYITFVDADDWLELNAIELLYTTLIKKGADVVRANYCRNFKEDKDDSKGNLADLANKLLYTSQEDFPKQVIDKLIDGTLPCYVVLLLTKKEYVLKTSLFKKDIYVMEDVIFYNELFGSVRNVYFLDEVTYHYYSNKNSCMRSGKYYIRNMYNIIKVNKYLKNIIENSQFNNIKRIQDLNTIHIKIIMEYLFELVKNSNYDKKKVIREVNNLFDNEEFKEILKESSIGKIPMYFKLPILLAQKRRNNAIFVFYKFRSFMSKLKDLLFSRKE